MSVGPSTGAEPEPMRGSSGAYYWLPRPEVAGLNWEPVTCHDLSRDPGAGHVALWPAVVRRLAAAWGRDPEALARRLVDRYAGLPRGRVARVRGIYLVHNGGDAPLSSGLDRVEARFGLRGKVVRHLLDDHERMLAGDPEAVQTALGTDLGLRGV